MSDLESLRRHLLGLGRVLLGYSGGVDSALLAVVGRQSLGPDRFLAVIGRSASYPESQWRSAVDLARRFDVPLLEVDTAELADPRYLENPTNRCYFCKTELWQRLGAIARARGSDTGSWRSGAMARWVASGMAKNNRVVPLTWSRTALRYWPCPTSNLCSVTCSAWDGCSWVIRAG